MLKIALFVFALALAALNRLWLTDRLAAGAPGARRTLLISITAEGVVGLGMVTAAAFLASSVPGAHATPVWPFPWQFSLVTVTEGTDFRREVLTSLLSIGAAILTMVAALAWRRFRLIAMAVLAGMVVWRGPSFALLTVQAYPTSFQTSPTGFSAASITRGRMLFMRNCAACHGPGGTGNGPLAAGLRIRPADLTQPHIWGHTDGEMFWWLTHGIDDPDGGLAMPGFGGAMPADDRWALIDYVRAHNAGVAIRRTATFAVPLRAPGIAIACNGIPASGMADLSGHAVHVIAGAAARDRQPVPPQAGVSTVDLVVPSPDANDLKPAPGSCVAADPTAWNGYAILAGLPPNKLAGAEFLVDPNGWLRAVKRPGATGGWHTRDDLLAKIRLICTHPIEQPSGGQHEHHH